MLTDVLDLPWGFEIYGLLTRWNPLNVQRPYALPYNGKNVLVVGLGPAGYTLSHYLLNEGFGVVGIDGLKIEPLPDELTGVAGGPPRPIRDWSEIYRPLDERVLEGFGGVSEYGITVRWDKNFLTLIHLTLARREKLRIYGGVRFGGTLTIDDAWDYGFDHVAIATGAGRPTIIDMKNNLIRGIRKASDFLMALQLTGAFKEDDALESAGASARGRHRRRSDRASIRRRSFSRITRCRSRRCSALRSSSSPRSARAKSRRRSIPKSRSILDEFLATRDRASATSARARPARARSRISCRLVRGWGGVSLVYRKRMQDSPAYRLNHEEVKKALEEGIDFVENLNPVEAVPDDYGARQGAMALHAPSGAETPASASSFPHAPSASRREPSPT